MSRRAGADCTVFLRALAEVLEFSGELPTIPSRPSIAGSVVVLGTNQSQSAKPGGGFSSTPTGHWTAMKLFLDEGDGGST